MIFFVLENDVLEGKLLLVNNVCFGGSPRL